MAWDQQSVTVTADAEEVHLQIGPEGFTLPRDYLRAITTGEKKEILMLLTYMLIEAKKAGVSFSNLPALKAFIEGRTWPW